MIEHVKQLFLHHVAKGIDSALNGPLEGSNRTTGFCLLVFPFEGNGAANYVTNGARREDMVKLLRTTADALETGVFEDVVPFGDEQSEVQH